MVLQPYQNIKYTDKGHFPLFAMLIELGSLSPPRNLVLMTAKLQVVHSTKVNQLFLLYSHSVQRGPVRLLYLILPFLFPNL